MRIILSRCNHPNFCFEILPAEGKREGVFVQSDWDYPGVASTFGWSLRSVQRESGPKCCHYGTDGTVACPDCGMLAGDFIRAAYDYLCDNDGAEADDPGYF